MIFFHIPKYENTDEKITSLIQPIANVIKFKTKMNLKEALTFINNEYRMTKEKTLKLGLIHEIRLSIIINNVKLPEHFNKRICRH